MRVILLLFFFIFLNAKTMTADYYAKYGWFGTIAEAKASYESNATDYKIHIKTKTKGFATTFVKLTQYYDSVGKVKNGILIPQKYINTIIRNGKTYKIIYTFDYKNKKITKTKFQEGKLKYTKTLPYFVQNDILSLYFNLPKLMNIKSRESKTFYALGGRKSDGRIDITFPKKDELEDLQDTFDDAKGIYIKANLYNKVFAGDKGILYLVIKPSNWVTTKGMVKNVLKVGDLKGGIKNFKLIP